MLRLVTCAAVLVTFGTTAQAQYQNYNQNNGGSGWWHMTVPNPAGLANYHATSSPYGGRVSFDTSRYHYEATSTPWGGSVNRTPLTTNTAAYSPTRTTQTYTPLPVVKNDWTTGDVLYNRDGSISYAHTTTTSLGTKSTRFYQSKSEYLAAVAKEQAESKTQFASYK